MLFSVLIPHMLYTAESTINKFFSHYHDAVRGHRTVSNTLECTTYLVRTTDDVCCTTDEVTAAAAVRATAVVVLVQCKQ